MATTLHTCSSVLHIPHIKPPIEYEDPEQSLSWLVPLSLKAPRLFREATNVLLFDVIPDRPVTSEPVIQLRPKRAAQPPVLRGFKAEFGTPSRDLGWQAFFQSKPKRVLVQPRL